MVLHDMQFNYLKAQLGVVQSIKLVSLSFGLHCERLENKQWYFKVKMINMAEEVELGWLKIIKT